jgi:hypothetical protein
LNVNNQKTKEIPVIARILVDSRTNTSASYTVGEQGLVKEQDIGGKHMMQQLFHEFGFLKSENADNQCNVFVDDEKGIYLLFLNQWGSNAKGKEVVCLHG